MHRGWKLRPMKNNMAIFCNALISIFQIENISTKHFIYQHLTFLFIKRFVTSYINERRQLT